MYYLVTVEHNGMAAHLTRSDCEGFYDFMMCCISSGVDEPDDYMLWNGSEEDGNVRSKYEEDKGTEHEDGDSDTA